jgi:hypothetical protein
MFDFSNIMNHRTHLFIYMKIFDPHPSYVVIGLLFLLYGAAVVVVVVVDGVLDPATFNVWSSSFDMSHIKLAS